MSELVASAASIARPTVTLVPPTSGDVKTVCVLGAPRGGTSAIAGIVRYLGVPMGREVDEASNEDTEFRAHGGDRDLFAKAVNDDRRLRYIAYLRSLVETRNGAHPVWGWKDPIAGLYIADIVDELRNPHFIFVARDLVAIAQREASVAGSAQKVLLAYMRNACNLYGHQVDFLAGYGCPSILVSYERMLRSPGPTASDLAQFLGAADDAVEKVSAFAQNYVKADRRTGAISRTDGAGASAPPAYAGPESAWFTSVPNLALNANPQTKGMTAQAVADRAYAEAAAAINSHRVEAAEQQLAILFSAFADHYPSLSRGAAGVMMQLAGGTGQRGETELPYPDQVCGGLFTLGLADLIAGRARRAFLHMRVAHEAILNRLILNRGAHGVVLCRSLYWTCLFHLARAATGVGRDDMIEFAAASFQSAQSWDVAQMERFGGWDQFDVHHRRLHVEILNKPV